MTRHTCDVAVIGAGTAGLAAERAARRQGARTLLIDDRFAGTLCATAGCMPSKLLIAAADRAHTVRSARTFGIETGQVAIDGRAVMARVRDEREKFVAATRQNFEDLPQGTCLKAKAAFATPDRLVLDNGDSVEARAFVIATGSEPQVPPPFEGLGALALTNQDVFELQDLPRSIGVIGAGAIGLELAQAFARLGVRTALFDQGANPGPTQDRDIQAKLLAVLSQDIEVHLNVQVEAELGTKSVRLSWSGDSEGTATFDKLLVAAGRAPTLDGLDLKKTGLSLDENGVPHFDRATLQCGESPIFIAGDADADVPVLHEAGIEGSAAGLNAATYPDMIEARRTPPFSLTFIDPPLATLGTVDASAPITGASSYEDQGRAKVENRAQGMVRLYADQDGRLIGAELFAPGADHMVHLLCAAIMRGETASDVLDLPLYHPTLEEGLKDALREVCQKANAPPPLDRDPAKAPGG